MSASLEYVANRAQFEKLSVEFRHHGAQAKVQRVGSLLHIGYTGPISLKTIDSLEGMIRPCRWGVAASLERMDTAMLAWAGPVSVNEINFPRWTPPSAVIVGRENYSRTKEFCSLLGRLGVLRVAFLPHQLDLAQEWVDCYRQEQTQAF